MHLEQLHALEDDLAIGHDQLATGSVTPRHGAPREVPPPGAERPR